jgi:hypothetical protein
MAKKETEVQVAQNTGVQVAQDWMQDFMGMGMEGADKDSFAIPFLMVLQKMSPLVDEDNGKYVDGAKAGMFYNTVTGELYDGKAGLDVIPCAYRRTYIQWGGREGDGGFKGEFTPEAIEDMRAKGEIVEHEGKLYKPNADGTINEKKNDYFADTRTHYVLTYNAETGAISQAILPLASSQIKKSKMLMTLLSGKKITMPGTGEKRTPPTFANIVRLTTVAESNDQGNWSGVKFELNGMVQDRELFNEAKAFHEAINAGSVKVDFSRSDVNGSSSEKEVSSEPVEGEGF